MTEAEGQIPPMAGEGQTPPIASGVQRVGGLTIASLVLGIATLIASGVLVTALIAEWSATVVTVSLCAGIATGIAAVICGALVLEKGHDTLLLLRDRVLVVGGSLLVAFSLVLALFVEVVLMSVAVEPATPQPAQLERQARLVPQVTPLSPNAAMPVETPAAKPAEEGGAAPAAGTEAPAAPAAGTESPAAPAAGTESPAAPAPGAESAPAPAADSP